MMIFVLVRKRRFRKMTKTVTQIGELHKRWIPYRITWARAIPVLIVALALGLAGFVIAPNNGAVSQVPKAVAAAPLSPLTSVINFSQCQNDAPPSTNLG